LPDLAMHFGLLPMHLDDLTPPELATFVVRLEDMHKRSADEDLWREHNEKLKRLGIKGAH